ncbi:hypothetical protein P7K49_037061 [Saguinus oedipus]|uniref:Uncharacterized protein n=1 Tax=Saguinus oedipus TaxID=9490 RepID=A0ABQ9TM76_SAGOE|nr:hypothetical protein P7K49_037061 [Saguinus oedipus]
MGRATSQKTEELQGPTASGKVAMGMEAGETMPPDTSKMLKLAQQCLERAQSTAAKLGGSLQ